MKLFSIFVFMAIIPFLNAQDNTELPYKSIPDYPNEFNACTVVARMVDGLGFRYYWATEGLRDEDLQFKPSEEARTSAETLEHIYGLCSVVLNSVKKAPNIRPSEQLEMTFDERRKATLSFLKEASDILKSSNPKEMEEFNIVFQRGETSSEFPFWNQLNGPLADALWHVGQVVSMRRSSGNPFNSKVSVFSGNVRE
jgi:hypothetical protein